MSRLIGKILQPFWRLSRGMTLGAQGMVIDANNCVLLVRHGYRPGWHLPGGGVEWGESMELALRRELQEEVGVDITKEPELHGIFTNFTRFPGDHIAVYIVRDWHQSKIPSPGLEIREQKFVSLDSLPDQLAAGARNRIVEVFEGVARSNCWVK